MNGLVRAELLKFRTTRSSRWMVASTLLAVLVGVASTMATAGDDGSVPLETTEGVRNVLSAGASAGALVIFILGIVSMTGEHRFQTITQTFLVAPVRSGVVVAKLIATVLLGLALGVASAAATMAVALPWLAHEGAPARFVQDVVPVAGGTLAATALYGVLGVAVGALFRNQTAAVAVSLVWMLIAESLLVGFAPSIGRWLPTGAAEALSSYTPGSGDLLPMWAGALVLCAYVAGFATAGARVALRRDVA